MIAKANQRAGSRQLATHLLNAYDNERVEIANVRGAVAQDLHGAFSEWRAISKGTQCKKYLYSMSLNPDPGQGPLTREQYLDFISRVENKMGLAAQPRAVVFHVKDGREHAHVVWSRIDVDNMRAVQISHDRQKLRQLIQDFARDHGLELPAGLRKDRGSKRFNERARQENLAEKQQQERSGISKAQRRRDVTDVWQRTDSGQALIAALEEKGYLLARGDKSAYVVVDIYGEAHSLARQIEGVKTKELKARLKDFPPDRLPAAQDARAFADKRREERLRPTQETFRDIAARRREELARAHEKRRSVLAPQHAEMRRRQVREIDALGLTHQQENRTIAEQRSQRQPRGLTAFLGRITGIQALINRRQRRQDEGRSEEQRAQREALERRHQREAHEFRRIESAIRRVEIREKRSLETALRREQFRLVAAPQKMPERQPLDTMQRDFLKDFNEKARKPAERRPPPPLSKDFKESARPPEEQSPLSKEFQEALKRRAEQQKQERTTDRGRRRGPDNGNGD